MEFQTWCKGKHFQGFSQIFGRLIADNHNFYIYTYNQRHIDSVLQLRLADVEAIRQRKFRICADTINSVGGLVLPDLFKALGVDYEILRRN